MTERAERYLAAITLLRPLNAGDLPDQSLPPLHRPGLPDHPVHFPPHPARPIMPVPPGGAATLPIEPGGPSFPVYVPVRPGEPSHPVFPPMDDADTLPYPDGVVYLLVIVPGLGWRYVRVDMGQHPEAGLPEEPPAPQPKS